MKMMMNRISFLSTVSLALCIAAVTTGCNKTQEVAKPVGEVEIVEYCSGPEYNSDSKHFRSTATGESQDREIAKKKARSTAESRLARTVSSTVKAVTDNFVSSTEFNNREEATESFNELARVVVDQELRGAIVICEKLTQRPNGIYVSYVSLELSGEKVASKYNEKITEDERIKADYNYERFKEEWKAEMEKIGG